jgi:hypothetical protein
MTKEAADSRIGVMMTSNKAQMSPRIIELRYQATQETRADLP